MLNFRFVGTPPPARSLNRPARSFTIRHLPAPLTFLNMHWLLVSNEMSGCREFTVRVAEPLEVISFVCSRKRNCSH
jgi:hypothetical protein